MTLHQCANEEWSSSSDPTSQRIETTFDVSITSATLFLLSRGSLSTGSLRVVTSNEVNDTARVSVTAHYSRREVLGVTKLCLITRAQGENGVGIFVSFMFVLISLRKPHIFCRHRKGIKKMTMSSSSKLPCSCPRPSRDPQCRSIISRRTFLIIVMTWVT